MIFRTFNLFLGGPLRCFTFLLPPVLGKASAISSTSDKLEDFLSAGHDPTHLQILINHVQSLQQQQVHVGKCSVCCDIRDNHTRLLSQLCALHMKQNEGGSLWFFCCRDLPPVDTF